MNLAVRQRYNPPKSPEEFDALCMRLMERKWDSSDVRPHGRRGHAQKGVDFFGTSGTKVYGGQSKLREEGNAITRSEILEEVEKAKSFRPPLSVYVILTSTKRDPKLQRSVADTNQRNMAAGLFSVDIRFWDDIEDLLETYTDVRDSFFGGISAEAVLRVQADIARVPDLVVEKLEARGLTSTSAKDAEDAHEEIDQAAEHLKSGEPDAALAILRFLRNKKWGALGTRQKYRVLANIGHALMAKDEYRESASYFVQASELQPTDLKGRSFKAIALYNLGQRTEAFSLAESICREDPELAIARAVWIQTAPAEMTIVDLESAVPENLRDDGDVQLSLAMRALDLDDLDAAERFARGAIQAPPKSWRADELLANVLLKRELRHYRYRFTPRSSARVPKVFEEVVGLLSGALEGQAGSIPAGSRARMHLNLGLSLEMLGRKLDAEKAAEAARLECPEDPRVSMRYAFLLYDRGQADAAVAELEQSLSRASNAPIALTLAQMLAGRNKDGDSARAIEVLRSHMGAMPEEPDLVQADYAEIYVKLVCHHESSAAAVDLLDQLDSTGISAITKKILQLIVRTEAGDRADIVDDAAALALDVREHGHWTDQRRMAVLCQDLGLYKKSLLLWKAFVPAEIAGLDVRRMLECARLARDDRFIMDFCRKLRENGVYDPYCIDLEITKLQEYNDPDPAGDILQQCIDATDVPEDAALFRTRLTLLGVRYHRPAWITKDASLLPHIDQVSPQIGLMVVEVLRHGAGAEAAVDFAYDLFRRHPSSFEAHLAIIASFGLSGGPEPQIPPPERVEAGTAVIYRELVTHKEDWFIIEDAPSPRPDLKEFSADHPTCLAVLGKSPSDLFSLRHHAFQSTQGKILSIQSKYVRRLQDCMAQIEIRFPDKTPVHELTFHEDAEGKMDLSPLLSSIDERAKSVQSVLDYYKKEAITVHVVASLLGRSIFDTTISLLASDDVAPKVCVGNQHEWEAARRSLDTCNGLVLDETAVGTLFFLNCHEILEDLPIPLLISEGTLSSIRHTDYMQLAPERRRGVLGKAVDRYYVNETSPEDAAAERERYEGLISLLEQECRIEAGTVVAGMDKEDREKHIKLVGRPTCEAICLAQEPGRVLWTDDLYVASLARPLAVRERAWTQSVLMWAADKGFYSHDKVAGATLDLLSHRCRWTRMWAGAFLEAAIRSDWDQNRKPFQDALKHFADPDVELGSLARLTAHSLIAVVQTAPPVEAAYLACCILDNVGSRRGGGMCLQALLREAKESEQSDQVRLFEKIIVVLETWFDNCRRSGICLH